mmetsp:Transcript_87733/g.189988  ORF Transcript_87733/g.189988 Transcript_87733/m.189988 type:complete len:80 (-) Transcript_87733:516-755(-)
MDNATTIKFKDSNKLVTPSDIVNSNIKFVGRLDYQTEGLLLATNNGDLKRFMEKTKFVRIYNVKVYGQINQDLISKFDK